MAVQEVVRSVRVRPAVSLPSADIAEPSSVTASHAGTTTDDVPSSKRAVTEYEADSPPKSVVGPETDSDRATGSLRHTANTTTLPPAAEVRFETFSPGCQDAATADFSLAQPRNDHPSLANGFAGSSFATSYVKVIADGAFPVPPFASKVTVYVFVFQCANSVGTFELALVVADTDDIGKGKGLVFTLFLSLMMIPNELVIITNFVTITKLGLRNTFAGLILPSVTSVFYIYLLKDNFEAIPEELYKAAKVDGTSDFKYLMTVMLPISAPTLVTIVILKVIECWNSYVWARLITDEQAYFLVSNGIQEIRENGFGRENIPAMMAAVVVISVPLLVLFLIFRKKIMAGVSRGGTKG